MTHLKLIFYLLPFYCFSTHALFSVTTPTHHYLSTRAAIVCTDLSTGRESTFSLEDKSFHSIALKENNLYVIQYNDASVTLAIYAVPSFTLVKECPVPIALSVGLYSLGNADLSLYHDPDDPRRDRLVISYLKSLHLFNLSLTFLQRIPVDFSIHSIFLTPQQLYIEGQHGEVSCYFFSTNTLDTLINDPQHRYVHFTPTHILTYKGFLFGNDIATDDLCIYPLKGPYHPIHLEVEQRIYRFIVQESTAFAFGYKGRISIIDLTTATVLKTIPSASHLLDSLAHADDFAYLQVQDVTHVLDMKKQEWLPLTLKNAYGLIVGTSITHIFFDQQQKIPHSPTKVSINRMQAWGKLRDYADCCPKAFAFEFTESPPTIEKDFIDFAHAILATGRFCYERIFDFIDINCIPLIIYCMEDDLKKRYLNSGEWKLRQKQLIQLLCYRLWMQQPENAMGLLIGLLLLKDPIAMDLYTHSRTYGPGQIGLKQYLKQLCTNIGKK